MANVTNSNMAFILTNWHDLNCPCGNINNYYQNNNSCCKCKQNMCSCDNYKCCKCNPCVQKEIILQYVFKEQIYYVKCVNGILYNYFPTVISDGSAYLSPENATYIAYNVSGSVSEAYNITGVPVVYPDYSSTDVGKGKQWPAKVFAPYVDSTAWPTYSIVDDFNDYKVPYFNLGFIVTKSYDVCQPSWATYYPAEAGPLNSQIKQLRSLGGDVCVSFGGAAGMPIHINCPDVNSLFKQYQLFCDAYGLTRIDFDIEGSWINSVYSQQNMNNAKALKMLQNYYKNKGQSIQVWFTLPILPQGLTNDGLNILRQAINVGVDITGVNAMTMDYGDSPAPDPTGKMGMYGIQAITSLYNQLNTLYNGSKSPQQLWAMIGTTPMLGVNDLPDEIFKQSDASQTLSFAQQKSIGMISMWSANRDLAGSSVTGIVQQPNDFTKIFNVYNS